VQVSVRAGYDKLRKTETQVARALVRRSAVKAAAIVKPLGLASMPLLLKLNVKILDGNHLAGTERRLEETRRLNSKPLPGHALVVLDPQAMLMTDVFPCEDAYAQERSLLIEVLATVAAHDCWIADRNFGTTEFLFGIKRLGAFFVIRQHASTLTVTRLQGKRKLVGPCDGGKIYEQAIEIDDAQTGETLVLRQITVELDEPTRNDEHEIHILTNVAPRIADAVRIAAVYRQRWTIENAFQELDQALNSEINTLCYPRAALLCFSIGVVLYNTMSVLKSTIRAEQPDTPPLSGYYLAEEISATHRGMLIAIPRPHWTRTFARLSSRQMASTLRSLAAKVDPTRFRKNTRGPKKPPPKRNGGLKEKHVSTARLLAERIK
jgi:IS4 transposase